MTSSGNHLSFRACLIAMTSVILLALAFGAQTSNAACDNPYAEPYYESNCGGSGAVPPPAPVVPKTVSIKISKACKKKSFRVRPVISGGIVSRVTAWSPGKKFAKLKAPYSFRVQVKKLRKGKKYRVKFWVRFTTGESEFVTAKFKTCS